MKSITFTGYKQIFPPNFKVFIHTSQFFLTWVQGVSGQENRPLIGWPIWCTNERHGPGKTDFTNYFWPIPLYLPVLGYWRLRGNFCQYIHEGTKLEAPKLVSGPSIMPKATWSKLIVAFNVATACEWVRPHRLVPSTDKRRSPFCKMLKKNPYHFLRENKNNIILAGKLFGS